MIKKAVQVEEKVIAYDEIDREIFSVEGTFVRYTEFNLQVRKDNKIFFTMKVVNFFQSISHSNTKGVKL